jgi:hypothetical protein
MIDDTKNLVKNFKNVLKEYLGIYNDFLTQTSVRHNDYNLQMYSTFYIPNNNIKFYCLVVYNTLYFFSVSSDSVIEYDFYIRLNGIFNTNVLLEGYMYDKVFMVSDILLLNKLPLSVEYSIRYNVLYDILSPILSKLCNINNALTIQIHKVFTELPSCNSQLYVETVLGHSKSNVRIKNIDTTTEFEKIIRPTSQSDVYKVYDPDTQNYQGILYVKSIQDSRYLLETFKECNELKIKCKFNEKFSKFTIERPIDFEKRYSTVH